MVSRNYTTDAIVLRIRPLGEKDRIVSLLSRDRGKIPTVAKGARRPGSRLAAATQPFTFAAFHLAQGRNFDIVTQVVIHDTHYALRADVLATACAACATELLDRALSERHEEPRLFDLLLSTLRTLAHAGNHEVTLRAFQLRAATQLGYRPELSGCVRCGRPAAQHLMIVTPRLFSFNLGGLICAECRSYDLACVRIGAGTVETLRSLLNAPPEQLAPLHIADLMRGELTRVVDGWLEHRLELRLRSKEFLHEVLATIR